jgi:nucleoporin NUP159
VGRYESTDPILLLVSLLTLVVMGLYWLKNSEMLMVHSPKPSANLNEDNKYHLVKCNKEWTEFEFHAAPWDPLLAGTEGPSRDAPPRFSAIRLQKWEPILDDMLIITSSNADSIAMLTHTSASLAADGQDTYNQWVFTTALEGRQAAVPRLAFAEGDSVLIGEALDLSATEKVLRPAALLEDIDEAPWPLPAYLALTNEGLLMAWWVVWNRSIEAGTRYPHLVSESAVKPSASSISSPAVGQSTTPAKPAPSNAFSQAQATFGSPTVSVPQFGATGLGSTPPFLPKKPAQPFGQSAAPSFGAPSVMGGTKAPAFGATGGLGGKPNPWGAAPQATSSQTPTVSPFSAASGASGFAKFGTPSGGSTFSSFGSNNGSQSGFASVGQKPTIPGFRTEPSAGSTVTVGSGTGSSFPSWTNTPPQQSSVFGAPSKTSFNTSSFESRDTDTSSAESRKRDEVTPTPQAPTQSERGLFGLAGGFKLGTTFAKDGTAKDDPAKPAASSSGGFFGSDFASGLGGPSYNALKAPATPAKDAPRDISTTPASPPRQQKPMYSFPPTKESATPKAPPLADKASHVEDAPLPPDFLSIQTPKSANDDLPPLAGSPGVEVEAPSSSVEASPVDGDEEGDYSDEEVEEDESDEGDEAEEPSPSDATRRPQPSMTANWSFQESVTQSPRVFPPAPTPPAAKSGATSTSARSTSPGQPGMFRKPSTNSSMPAKSIFPPPAPSTSASAPRVRREPVAAPGSSLSESFQQSRQSATHEVSDLEDKEDERIRAQLARPIEPSRDLDGFIAYQKYDGSSPSKQGHAAQIEAVYRDINGMIDGLGLNARALKSFTTFHKQSQSGHKVDRQAVDEVADDGEDGTWFDEWTIGEVEALRALEDKLEYELDCGRVQDIVEKLSQLAGLLRDKAKLMTRINDIRRQIINRKDPEKTKSARNASLPKEQADEQKKLRVKYARLLMLLSQAEEASVVLRSRLASHNSQNGKHGAVPTVEAVKKTITKMTTIAEQRNNDITLIESQMRKTGLMEQSRPSSSASRTVGTPRKSRGSMRSSIADTPFATPPTSRSKMSLSELNRHALTPDVDTTPTAQGGYGLTYSPEGTATPGSELARMSDMVEEKIDSLRETARRRKQVAGGLKKALIARGIKTSKVH